MPEGVLGLNNSLMLLTRHPRLGVKKLLIAELKEQARQRPVSRAAFLASLGFIGLIRAAPFDDGETDVREPG